MKTIIVVGLFLAAPAIASAACSDNGADHGREQVKKRPAPSPFPTVSAITVADMLKWLVPHVLHFNDTALIGTEEREIVHLRAFVRLFKCEADADYHLELADSRTAKGRRVIAEAPESASTVRT